MSRGEVVKYTDSAQVLNLYDKDPTGDRSRSFFADVLGIQDFEAFLSDAGLKELATLKQNRGIVGYVKSHTLQTTPYNLFGDINFTSQVSQERGIPAVTLVVTHENDTFVPSPEKMEAFGKQKYFVGYNAKGKPQFVQVDIQPEGVKREDGTFSPASGINDVVGYSLKDIFVTVREVVDPRSTKVPSENGTIFLRAALGVSWEEIMNVKGVFLGGQKRLSVTELHRFLFERTIQRLSDLGEISKDHRMIFSDLSLISRAILQHAQPTAEFVEMLSFQGNPYKQILELLCLSWSAVQVLIQFSEGKCTERQVKEALTQQFTEISPQDEQKILNLTADQASRVRDIAFDFLHLSFDEQSGLLLHNGQLDPSVYYTVMSALVDVDLANLDGLSTFFRGKVLRAHNALRAYGLESRTIKIPNGEIPEFDTTRIHPTGMYSDLTQIGIDVFQEMMSQGADRNTLSYERTFALQKYLLALQSNQGDLPYQRSTQAIVEEQVLKWAAGLMMKGIYDESYTETR